MKKSKPGRPFQISAGIIGLIISVLIFIRVNEILDFIAHYVTENYSSDNQLSPLSVFLINGLFVVFAFVLFLISGLLLLGILNRVYQYLLHKIIWLANGFFDVNKALRFFLNDEICAKNKFSLWVFLLTLFAGVGLHFSVLFFGQPPYEGNLEKASAMLLLISSFMVFISIFQIKRKPALAVSGKTITIILLVVSGVIFMMFGEEISWGQRIFGWKSTGVFEQYNYQNETNLHNFLNPVLDLIYPTVGLSAFLLLFAVRLFPAKGFGFLSDLFYPHPSLFFLLLLMAGASFRGQSELYESMLSLFLFFYGLRLFVCLHKWNSRKISHQ